MNSPHGCYAKIVLQLDEFLVTVRNSLFKVCLSVFRKDNSTEQVEQARKCYTG